MRRNAALCIFIIMLTLGAVLCCTAVDPGDFTGEWYASADQSLYQFREGIVYCVKHPIMEIAEDSVSGAYVFGRNSIFLFAEGIPGLETEKQLYLVKKDKSRFLCENRDGTGTIYFIRYNQ